MRALVVDRQTANVVEPRCCAGEIAFAQNGPKACGAMPSARFSLLKEFRQLPGNPQKQPEVITSRQAMRKRLAYLLAFSAGLLALIHRAPAQTNTTPAPVVLHAARLLDIETGRISAPGEVLLRCER